MPLSIDNPSVRKFVTSLADGRWLSRVSSAIPGLTRSVKDYSLGGKNHYITPIYSLKGKLTTLLENINRILYHWLMVWLEIIIIVKSTWCGEYISSDFYRQIPKYNHLQTTMDSGYKPKQDNEKQTYYSLSESQSISKVKS